MAKCVYIIKSKTVGENIGEIENLVGITTEIETAYKAAGQYLTGIPSGATIKVWAPEKRCEVEKLGDVFYGVTVFYGNLTDYYWMEEVKTLD